MLPRASRSSVSGGAYVPRGATENLSVLQVSQDLKTKGTELRTINQIIVHCADTPPDMDIGAKEIDQWHRERGWSQIGYHFVIRRDGTVEAGRPLEKAGAHTYGHNKNSIGICLVGGTGGFNFTFSQLKALISLVNEMKEDFNVSEVLGHRDLDSSKACPQFGVSELLKATY